MVGCRTGPAPRSPTRWLVTLVLGGLNVAALGDAELRAATGEGGALLVVLGALLLGVGLRLLALKLVAVGDLLPALVVAPLLTALVDALR